MNKFIQRGLVAAGVFGLVASAQAALPESVATDIAGAKTDALAALALMITVAVAIWGLRRIMGLFGR